MSKNSPLIICELKVLLIVLNPLIYVWMLDTINKRVGVRIDPVVSILEVSFNDTVMKPHHVQFAQIQ